jgi:uncharacterized protein (DUF58 family)
MTARGWWCLFTLCLVLLVGLLVPMPPLALTGLAGLMWFGLTWLLFNLRLRMLGPSLRLRRRILDERGPVSTLWAGKTVEAHVELRVSGLGRLPHVLAVDPVPFSVELVEGEPWAEGELSPGRPLRVRYRVRCPAAGVARFEGLRVEVADLHGFFHWVTFVRAPVELRVLPSVYVDAQGRPPALKRHNQLLPPGINRLRQAGSSSELLDLRDYQPGDPPRTIAWKVSARRDRLITKEFESEVPVRCTLFLDASTSVRVPSARRARERRPVEDGQRPATSQVGKPLDRLVEIAAAVMQANRAVRDLTGLVVFDEDGVRALRPGRTGTHHNEMMGALARAAALAPVAGRADPDELLPLAYAFAEEAYPELLRPEVNAVPWWLVWFVGFPRYRRRWRGLIEYLHRRKVQALLAGTTVVPLGLLVANFIALFLDWLPEWAESGLVQGLVFVSPLAVLLGWLIFLFSLLTSWRLRRLARWRKRLAALLAARYGPSPGGIDALLEDDDLFSLYMQRFLAEHRVPYSVSLYDEAGRYLLARPEKVGVLARALTQAVGRGRDNELFVLLADVLELDEQLSPLLQAVRVALSRHHQVVLVCAWPPGLPPPGADPPKADAGATLHRLLSALDAERLHAAYARTRRALTRLGATVVCAAAGEPVQLVLERMDQLRAGGRRRP